MFEPVNTKDSSGPIIPAVIRLCSTIYVSSSTRNGTTTISMGSLTKRPFKQSSRHLSRGIVHMIESHGLNGPMPRSPIAFLDQALDLSRNIGWQTQADVATARGIDVYVYRSQPSKVGPFSMGEVCIRTQYMTRLGDLNRPFDRWSASDIETRAAKD